ncbi:hypothetical protein A5320_19280 [Rheinheimera sp. SA_1]|nr:hypothetical protein A5320_19280 [Rheinheimera sp. SA_1]
MAFNYISFFGLNFQLVSNNYRLIPPIPSFVKSIAPDISPSNGPSDNVDIKRLYIETNYGVKIWFACPFPVKFGGQFSNQLKRSVGTPQDILNNTSVKFELGLTSTNNDPTGLDVDIGPFKFGASGGKVSIEDSENGLRDFWVSTNANEALLEHPQLPVAIQINSHGKFRLFNESNTRLIIQFRHIPFSLATKLGIQNSLLKLWHIHQQDLDVEHILSGVNLRFVQDKRYPNPLYLHPFLKSDQKGVNHTVAAVGLDCAALELHLARNNNLNSPLKIESLKAFPTGDRSLHTYGLVANNRDGYHRWHISKPVELAIRVAEQNDYHGLLLRTQSKSLSAKKVYLEAYILGIRREVKLSTDGNAEISFSNQLGSSSQNDHVAQAINIQVTSPYFTDNLKTIAINRPGIAMSVNGSDVNCWQFRTPTDEHKVCFPLCPDEAMMSSTGNIVTALHELCNQTYRQLFSDNAAVTHESNLLIDGVDPETNQMSKPSLKQLFRGVNLQSPQFHISGLPESSVMAAPGLGVHINKYNFGNYVITKTWQDGQVPEYIPIIADKNGKITDNTKAVLSKGFAMDPDHSGDTQNISVSSLTLTDGLAIQGSELHIVGVVKLGKETSLLDILQQEKVLPVLISAPDGGLRTQLPHKLQSASWTGLILFQQALDISKFELLESLLPSGFQLKLRFVAVSPDRGSHFSTYGLVAWQNPELGTPSAEPSIDSSEELLVQMAQVEITWIARKLTRFMTKTLINFRSFTGARKTKTETNTTFTRIDVIGSIDQETEEIRFLAQANEPITLLDKNGPGVGPLKQVYIKQVEVTRNGNQTRFNVDGDVDLQPFELSGAGNWDFDKGDKIRFGGLKFSFLDNLKLKGNWLSMDYPSLQFEFAKGWKIADFGSFNLDLKRIGFDTADSTFDWGNLLPVLENPWTRPAMRLGLQLNLGKLPLLSENPFKELIFDFELALPFEENGGSLDFTKIDWSKCRLYLRALGFNKLNLKLMRFLEISAEVVSLENKSGSTLWLYLQKLRLKILNTTLIDDFTFGHYWSDSQKGFIGLLENENLPSFSLITIDWLLVGRNLRLNGNDNDDLLKAIVSVEPCETSLKNKIHEAYKTNALIPSNAEHIGEWVFAAGFRMFDEFLIGKFLVHDGAYYGLAIEGPFLKKWFGYELAISVLYIIKDRPEEDMFRLSLRVPSVSLGGIAFNGGVIVIEVQMNGGFLLDMGYPWLANNGERQWERGFGVMLSGLMGRGGSFIAKRSSVRIKEINGEKPGKLTLLEGGMAAMVGIGGDFRSGPLRVTVYAGIYYTCEGSLLFFTPSSSKSRLDLVGLRLSGAIGIQARGIAELDWWIISIRVEVVAGAEARLTLFWGALEHHQPGSSDLPADINGAQNRIGVRVDFVLYARVSARACIGSGWLKVCKGISVGISLPYQTTLYLS